MSSKREKAEPVFCVGWKVFIHWPLQSEQGSGAMATRDVDGRPQEHDLADGQQVEILSWRPRSREGVLYQIRRQADGREWWIGGRHLRRQLTPAAAPAETAAAAG